MAFKLSKNSIENRAGVDERLIGISDLAIQLTLIDFGHGPDSGLRTAERQAELHKDGKSRADGYNHRSRHQDGKALDFYAYIDGHASWEREHLAMVGAAFLQAAAILEIPVTWGGLWKSGSHPFYGWDMPHIELLED